MWFLKSAAPATSSNSFTHSRGNNVVSDTFSHFCLVVPSMKFQYKRSSSFLFLYFDSASWVDWQSIFILQADCLSSHSLKVILEFGHLQLIASSVFCFSGDHRCFAMPDLDLDVLLLPSERENRKQSSWQKTPFFAGWLRNLGCQDRTSICGKLFHAEVFYLHLEKPGPGLTT